ncbi:hypothetical protein ONE63_008037 [Megalurothrips usitatus]|uniref:ATP-dependent DNA helicase n=1 Tax=Megalurothrips usitatus TaxID=439358 RepID=A0AAV7XPK9_9NEOP|nr:hypothetical protein ONE63_008037 [Megalurothrips usitatus]
MPSVEFTKEQRSVLDLVKLQIEHSKTGNIAGPTSLPKSIIVQGKAGTRKSLVIHAMKSLIHESLGPDALVLLGPTGVSALNIGGSTINSKLHVHPQSKELLPLSGNALHQFRQKFAKTLFVIVDEYSMVGCRMLTTLEKRLKEALDRDNEKFGGVYIYFFGDIQQLAPVLSNISTGKVTTADYNILKKRFNTSVTPQERNSFNTAIRLFPTRKEVDEYNQKALELFRDPATNQPMPIARIPAIHNVPVAKLGTENEAGGLKNVLYLSKGAKVMLRANLWTEQGLVNGAIGTVVDILYKDGANPPDAAPSAVFCTFDMYKGPYLNDEKTVVIRSITRQWKSKNGTECVREQLPLNLCYACSIHKSQGLTLEKAFINIGALREMSPGLTYTALSRVKSLTGLLLEPFGSKRLLGINNKKYIELRAEWIGRIEDKQIF